MGGIGSLARAGSWLPAVSNLVLRTPGLSAVAKWASGIAQARELPRFRPSFRRRFRSREGAGRPVVLWVDTFNDAFYPEVLEAGAAVLRAAGFQVRLPSHWLCCGRALYDFGWLDRARRRLRRALDVLAPEIEAGIPVVGLEPTCVATFRDELVNLLGHDEHARRLSSQTYTLAELLATHAGFEPPPRLRGEALVQVHCHQHALMGFDADAALLRATGLDVRVLDAGCCGMAGAFGLEAGAKHELSRKIGESGLLPAVRSAGGDVRIVADGFSCREQIAQGTGRRPLHLAQILEQALAESAP
jgi:Fe-S oxidoreductase